MENALEAIRLSVEPEATPEARTAGIAACRAILAALDPSAQMPSQPRGGTSIDASQIATLVGALRGVPPDQLLDLAITKLRAALPADASTPAPKGIAFHLVPISR